MPEETYKRRLILADGTVLEDCECGYDSKSLWCFLKGISFSEAFQIFSGPDKFNKIIFELDYDTIIDRIIYTGIEQITSVVQRDDKVNVRLEGNHIESEQTREFRPRGSEGTP